MISRTLDFLSLVFDWLLRIWNRIPENDKERIRKAAIDSFEDMLRKFYRQHWGTSK